MWQAFFYCVTSIIFLIAQLGLDWFSWGNIVPHLLGLLVVTPFLFIWLVSQGKWMGFADIEIIAWIGFFFGFLSGISAVFLAFYAGAVFAICFIIYHLLRGHSYATLRKIPIPFAPFLLLSWFITVITSWSIFSLFLSLFM